MLRAVVMFFVAIPSAALACPGEQVASTEAAKPALASTNAAVDPTHCAKSAALVGSNCQWSTGSMAQRVQAEGKDTSVTAKLQKQDQKLASQVAAPFKVGEMYVIANQVIEQADASATLAMSGKVLEVDGVKYFLVSSFQKTNS
jgi:hypothetical protein